MLHGIGFEAGICSDERLEWRVVRLARNRRQRITRVCKVVLLLNC